MAYVPLKKQGKKAQKLFYAQQRGSWNGLSPVTRVAKKANAYSRSKEKIYTIKEMEGDS